VDASFCYVLGMRSPVNRVTQLQSFLRDLGLTRRGATDRSRSDPRALGGNAPGTHADAF
jgi:hypothetical protein